MENLLLLEINLIFYLKEYTNRNFLVLLENNLRFSFERIYKWNF